MACLGAQLPSAAQSRVDVCLGITVNVSVGDVGGQLFSTAPRDGTAIGTIGRAALHLAGLRAPLSRFNPVQFSWLGTSMSCQDDAHLLFIRSDFGIEGLEDAALACGM